MKINFQITIEYLHFENNLYRCLFIVFKKVKLRLEIFMCSIGIFDRNTSPRKEIIFFNFCVLKKCDNKIIFAYMVTIWC